VLLFVFFFNFNIDVLVFVSYILSLVQNDIICDCTYFWTSSFLFNRQVATFHCLSVPFFKHKLISSQF